MEMLAVVRRSGMVLALLFGLVCRAPSEGRAAVPQAETADTIDLTLEQAIAIAEGNNPVYRRAVNQLDTGGAESRATWMGNVLPSVSVNLLNTAYDGNLTRQVRDVFGNPVENPESEWVYSSNTTQNLLLSWTLQGGNIWNSLRRVDVNDQRRAVQFDAAELDIAAQVRRQYFAVLQQRELLDVELAALDGRLRDQEAAQQRFRFAQVTRVDVLNAELAVEDQNRAIRQRERALDQALLDLRTTLSDPDLRPFRVVAQPVPLFDPSELPDDALVDRGLGAHPDIRNAEVNLQGARVDVSEAKANRWPSLRLSYRLGRQTFSRGGGEGLFDFSHDPSDLYNNFRVSLDLPYLSNYFSNRNSEVQAEVALRNQQETVRETRLLVEQQVRTQLIALRNQYETLVANRRTLEIAEEALQLAREQYRLGTLGFSDLQDQIDAARSAQREAIAAGYGFHDTLLDLEAAVGGSVRPASVGDGDPPGPVDPR